MNNKNRFIPHLSLKLLILLGVDFFGLLFSFFISWLFTYTAQQKATNPFAATLIADKPWLLAASALLFVFFCLISMAIIKAYHNIVLFSLESVLIRCILGIGIGSTVSAVLNYYVWKTQIYNKVTFICSTLIAMLLVCSCRVMYSHLSGRINMRSKRADGKRCLIIGAGFTGQSVLKELYHTTKDNYNPICFLDDDVSKISRNISGVPIYGPVVLLPEICKKHNIEVVIFAIPSCDDDRRKNILTLCSRTDCEIIEVPSLLKLSDEIRFMPQSQSVNVNELLNREVVSMDSSDYKKIITGKTVMVTGVGSIGSELCRQIATFAPRCLVMVDIYENNAYDIQQELVNKSLGDIAYVEIASVRDRKKMDIIFDRYRPDVVFHAAAHKHVPLMEHNPEESVKNNVGGTYNVALLCEKYEVGKMVLISTDKAVNPTNVMGATKRCCEMIMQYMAQRENKTEYVAVRFGNVLGSNGSVIPLFCNQIEAGGPVTVTHPDIIRYFMTIPEAVSLVLQAGAMAKGGEIFVLNMGEPVKITTLAENLIRMYGFEPYTQMPIKFVGLRPGEKLFEELLMDEENLKPTDNKKIFIGNQIEINPEVLEKNLTAIFEIADTNNSDAVVKYLHEMVPTFKAPAQVNN